MSQQPMHKSTGSFAVYSRSVVGIPNSRDKPAVYDLFLQPLHGGQPFSLTSNRGISGLGRSVTDVIIDPSGKYVAFRSDDPKKPKVFPPRLTTQLDHLYSNSIWVCALQSRTLRPVAVNGIVESYAWAPFGSVLAIETAEIGSGDDKKATAHIDLYFAETNRSQTWLQEPGLGSWEWWKNDEAILYHNQTSSRIVLRSVKDHRVLKRWILPEKSSFYRVMPSPNGKSLLVSTDSSLYIAREPDWRWRKILQDLSNVPDSTVLWLSDSEHLAIDHVGYANGNFTEANPPVEYHEVKIIKPFARFWSQPTVAKWTDDTSGATRISLVSVSKEKYVLILRGGTKAHNWTDTLEFYDVNGRKRAVLIKGFVDSIDVKFNSEPIAQAR